MISEEKMYLLKEVKIYLKEEIDENNMNRQVLCLK